jgi:hypothetical protein
MRNVLKLDNIILGERPMLTNKKKKEKKRVKRKIIVHLAMTFILIFKSSLNECIFMYY